MHFKHFSSTNPKNGFTMLELGPGDSVLSALFGYLNGAEAIYLLDVGSFASADIDLYRDAYDRWCKKNLLVRKPPDFKSFDAFLSSINALYLFDGLSGFENIKDSSVDFIFSHSVLEHVRKSEIDNVLSELYRISKPGAISSHNVDYMDHLGGAQNNLLFSDAIWESAFFAESGFYTNRIPADVLHQKIRDVGFNIIQEEFGSWTNGAMRLDAVHVDLRNGYNQERSAPTSSLQLSK